jgi:hypothetical protein
VVTRKTDQAQQLIASAKLLRISSNPVIRDNIFVNRNLAKAEVEAEAAYRSRLRCRQAAAHRSNLLPNLNLQAVSTEPSTTHADVTMSLLNIANNPYKVVPPSE